MSQPFAAGATCRWQLAASIDQAPCGALECFSLHSAVDERAQLVALLSAEERARAARFHLPEHGRRYVVAHARLRQILAPLVGLSPAEIQFSTGPHGKPQLTGVAAAAQIHFNLSHSDDIGLVGWARQRDIGVDVERWRPMRDEAALVKRFFSSTENAMYLALPEERRTEGFFNAWTRKEAYVKAVGRGLGLPLGSFDVSMEGGAAARLLRPSALCDDGRDWSLAAPQAMPAVSLAVVLEAEAVQLQSVD